MIVSQNLVPNISFGNVIYTRSLGGYNREISLTLLTLQDPEQED